MSRTRLSVALLSLAVIAGCIVPSLHSLYTEKDLVFNPALLGNWTDADGNLAQFTQTGAKAYKLVYVDKDGKTASYAAHLAQIRDALFLDLYPEEVAPANTNGGYQLHILPMHSFWVVHQITPELKSSFMNPDWLKKYLADNPKEIAHEQVETGTNKNRIVLTASTEELQAFLIAHLNTPGAFSPLATFRKLMPMDKVAPESRP